MKLSVNCATSQDVFVLWPVFYIFVILVQIPGTQNGHECVLEPMKSRFEPTRFEEKTMANTIPTLPGPGLVTKRPKMIENKNLTYLFLLMVKAQLRSGQAQDGGFSPLESRPQPRLPSRPPLPPQPTRNLSADAARFSGPLGGASMHLRSHEVTTTTTKTRI